MLERATRLWSMSPQITTVSPSIFFLCARMSRRRAAPGSGARVLRHRVHDGGTDALTEQQRRASLRVAK